MKILFFCFVLVMLWMRQSRASDIPCVSDLDSAQKLLGDKHKALTWVETTENDQKPLYISISNEGSKLHLEFFKSKEGMWASGPVALCPQKEASKIEAKIEKRDLVLGDTIPFFIKLGFGGGADFKLLLQDDGNIKISTFGWSGVFAPSTPQALTDARAQVKK